MLYSLCHLKRAIAFTLCIVLGISSLTAQTDAPDTSAVPEAGSGRQKPIQGYYFTDEYIETFPTQKEREEHLKKMESAVFEQYKPVLKKFTKSQAKMLIKLINRETNQSSYNILKAFLGSFRAGFWQTFGRFFGVNLKTGYNPDKDRKDAIIERVAVKVELGQL